MTSIKVRTARYAILISNRRLCGCTDVGRQSGICMYVGTAEGFTSRAMNGSLHLRRELHPSLRVPKSSEATLLLPSEPALTAQYIAVLPNQSHEVG